MRSCTVLISTIAVVSLSLLIIFSDPQQIADSHAWKFVPSLDFIRGKLSPFMEQNNSSLFKFAAQPESEGGGRASSAAGDATISQIDMHLDIQFLRSLETRARWDATGRSNRVGQNASLFNFAPQPESEGEGGRIPQIHMHLDYDGLGNLARPDAIGQSNRNGQNAFTSSEFQNLAAAAPLLSSKPRSVDSRCAQQLGKTNHGSHLKVFVYDIPNPLHGIEWYTEEVHGIFKWERELIKLMKNTPHRTRHIEEADFFYVPFQAVGFYALNSIKGAHHVKEFGRCPVCWEFEGFLLDHLRSFGPYWDTHRGRHVVSMLRCPHLPNQATDDTVPDLADAFPRLWSPEIPDEVVDKIRNRMQEEKIDIREIKTSQIQIQFIKKIMKALGYNYFSNSITETRPSKHVSLPKNNDVKKRGKKGYIHDDSIIKDHGYAYDVSVIKERLLGNTPAVPLKLCNEASRISIDAFYSLHMPHWVDPTIEGNSVAFEQRDIMAMFSGTVYSVDGQSWKDSRRHTAHYRWPAFEGMKNCRDCKGLELPSRDDRQSGKKRSNQSTQVSLPTNKFYNDIILLLQRARFQVLTVGDTLDRPSRDQSVGAGVIPVYFDAYKHFRMHLPLSDIIDWNCFSVNVTFNTPIVGDAPGNYWPQLEKQLRHLDSVGETRRLSESVAMVRDRFKWTEDGIVTSLMEMLALRIYCKHTGGRWVC